MPHLVFVTPSKITLEGKSLTKGQIVYYINRLHYRYISSSKYSKNEFISLLLSMLRTPEFPWRVKSMNFTFEILPSYHG